MRDRLDRQFRGHLRAFLTRLFVAARRAFARLFLHLEPASVAAEAVRLAVLRVAVRVGDRADSVPKVLRLTTAFRAVVVALGRL